MSVYSQPIKPRSHFLAQVMQEAERAGQTISLHKAKQIAAILYERQIPDGTERPEYAAPADPTFDLATRRDEQGPRNEAAARRRVSQKRPRRTSTGEGA